MTKLYDVSLPLQPTMLTWPGEPGPQRIVNETIAKSGVETSTLTIGSHTGTHIDAPRHFVPDMTEGIDSIPLEYLTGPCHVIELTNITNNIIEPRDLEQYNLKYSKIIFKTNNTVRRLLENPTFQEDYVCISLATAEYLISKNIHLVGIDYLSIERKGSVGHPVHMALLKKRIVNIEGLYLNDVPAGDYSITALPLRWVGSDGCPTRVILQSL